MWKGRDGKACVQQSSLGSCPCQLHKPSGPRETQSDLGSAILGPPPSHITSSYWIGRSQPKPWVKSIKTLSQCYLVSENSFQIYNCSKIIYLLIVHAFTLQNVHSDLLVYIQMLPFHSYWYCCQNIITSWCSLQIYTTYIQIGFSDNCTELGRAAAKQKSSPK